MSRSPSISLATGIPVHRSIIRAISSSVTLSRSKECRLTDCSVFFSSSASSFCSCGSLPYFNSAALLRSYSCCARSICALTDSISARRFCTFPIEAFSFSHFAFISLNCARISASSFCISARCSFESTSFSFCNAASSISCWIMRRWITSSSVGMESISVRIIAHASSIRSIALSGRKRSVI